MTGRTLCTHIADLISLACRCISPHEFLIRNRKMSTPCLWIHSIPRQDTFQQGFPPDCRRSRLHHSPLVTQNKVQRAAQRRVGITVLAFHVGKSRLRMITWPILCVQLDQYLPIPAARFTCESILYKKKRNFKDIISIFERKEISERVKTRIPGFTCKRHLAWVIHI